MKVYDKEALFMVAFDFLMIAVALWSFYSRGPAVHNVAILLYNCSRFKNNIVPIFSEEASKWRKKQKKAYKNLFGKFAPFAPFGFYIFLGIGVLLLKLLPGRMLGVYVIIFGFFVPMFERFIISDEMARMENEI